MTKMTVNEADAAIMAVSRAADGAHLTAEDIAALKDLRRRLTRHERIELPTEQDIDAWTAARQGDEE